MGGVQSATIGFLGPFTHETHVRVHSRTSTPILEKRVRLEVVLTEDSHGKAKDHLLHFFDRGVLQENLCFGVWFPSQGADRFAAVVSDIILPHSNEVHLHGNASFEGRYLTRATRIAKRQGAGLAMMHSHPANGWQDLSQPDVLAERDIVAYQAQSTNRPFLGMTIGADGYWSARFWDSSTDGMQLAWCDKVRIPLQKRYQIDWHPAQVTATESTPMLRRTIESWGIGVQHGIQRLRIGVVGTGSVGAIVAEALARIGISHITLIDPDKLEIHNLDRFIFGTTKLVGRLKVDCVKDSLIQHSTNERVHIRTIAHGIEYEEAYREALDCDILMSCVDRPVPRDVLNYIAISNGIPVVDAGLAVEVDPSTQSFESARWRTHLIIPGNACLRCTGQYSSSDVVAELDGSLDDSSYIANLPETERPKNQNVFPFSLGCASMQVNVLIRYLIAKDWWPPIQRQEYRFLSAQAKRSIAECQPHCAFRARTGLGSNEAPPYLKGSHKRSHGAWEERLKAMIGKIFAIR